MVKNRPMVPRMRWIADSIPRAYAVQELGAKGGGSYGLGRRLAHFPNAPPDLHEVHLVKGLAILGQSPYYMI
jgi:hypothetical protein